MSALHQIEKEEVSRITEKYKHLHGLSPEFILQNLVFEQTHGFELTDIERAQRVANAIEASRSATQPMPGDYIVCQGTKENARGIVPVYKNGHIEAWGRVSWDENPNQLSVCVDPGVPFVTHYISANELTYDTSGGYWLMVDPKKLQLQLQDGRRPKQFKVWGHCGPTGSGAIYFKAEVNVWLYQNHDIY